MASASPNRCRATQSGRPIDVYKRQALTHLNNRRCSKVTVAADKAAAVLDFDGRTIQGVLHNLAHRSLSRSHDLCAEICRNIQAPVRAPVGHGLVVYQRFNGMRRLDLAGNRPDKGRGRGGLCNRLDCLIALHILRFRLLCLSLIHILLDVMWIVFVGLMGTGVAFGANLTLRLAGIQELYGTKYSAENFGFCNLCVIPASIIGPYISGRLQDMEGGAYNGTFIMVIVLAVIAFILDFALRRTTRRTAS